MVQSRVGDSFYIRTHFELEPSPPYGLGFTRGDIFHVLDTLYTGPGQSHTRGGHWLVVRMGRDLREEERGIIPNQKRWGPLPTLSWAAPPASVSPRCHFLAMLMVQPEEHAKDRAVQLHLYGFPGAAGTNHCQLTGFSLHTFWRSEAQKERFRATIQVWAGLVLPGAPEENIFSLFKLLEAHLAAPGS